MPLRFATLPASTPRPPEAVRDLERVLALPRRPLVDCERVGRIYAPKTQALVEVVTERYSLGRRPKCKCREELGHKCLHTFNAVQSWILWELAQVSGVVGLVSVGGGKTFAGIVAPLAMPGCKSAVILAKPDQRIHYRNFYLRLREHFRVPSIVFDDGSSGYIVAGAPVLHFIPYSRLSRPDATDLLERVNPDFIICDEAHCVSSRDSARTRRLLRFLAKDESSQVRLCAWSGSFTKKSIRDMAHLFAHALGFGSPLPIDPNEVEAWAAVVDPSNQPDRTSGTAHALFKAFGGGAKLSPVAAALTGSESRIREGMRSRIAETAGVISTRSSSVVASLYVHQRVPPPMPGKVKDALAMVRGDWVRPDGEELVEVTEAIRCAKEVACGFHSYWAYPKGEPEDLIVEWFRARKEWNRELRAKLQRSGVHLDSPHLCERAATRAFADPPYTGDLPVWSAASWPDWRDVMDKVKPDPRTAWLDEWLALDAAKWAGEHLGIVWCDSVAFARKVAQLAKLPYHGGGPQAEANILAERGDRSIIASIDAHGESRDGLQRYFREQLVCQPPSSAKGWEQLLGRLCRDGQEADSVDTYVYLHVGEFKDAMRAAIRNAEFIEETTLNRQMLLMADLDFEL